MSAFIINESLQTTCTECNSSFKLNLPQLLAADGRVRCSECNEIFDANIHLIRNQKEHVTPSKDPDPLDEILNEIQPVSLHEAMNDGEKKSSLKNLSHFYWLIGILILISIGFMQWVYFNQLQLIKKPSRQNLVLSLCSVVPCNTANFKSTNQFKLLERNIFTHPTQANSLLISGSYINEAPFSQQAPSLKVSLFNLNGEVIAQRIFAPVEYNQDANLLKGIAPGENIHFKIEVSDPDTITITYEFEFI